MTSWEAHPDCPIHHRIALERAVNTCDKAWRAPLETGKAFVSIDDAERRVRCFLLVEGFELVKKGSGNKQHPAAYWACGHHGDYTRNCRKLKLTVELDAQGGVISKRKRDHINVKQSSCYWSVSVSYRSRTYSEKPFILSVKSLDHEGYTTVINPLIYTSQLRRLNEFRVLMQ